MIRYYVFVLLSLAGAGVAFQQLPGGLPSPGPGQQIPTLQTISPPVPKAFNCPVPISGIHLGAGEKAKAASGGGGQPDSLSLHDDPVTGGSGSVWVQTGNFGCSLRGSVGSHSHDTCHMFWMIDSRPVRGPVAMTEYARRGVNLNPSSKVDVTVEQFDSTTRLWRTAGTITIAHDQRTGFNNACAVNASPPHKITENWAWFVDQNPAGLMASSSQTGTASIFRQIKLASTPSTRIQKISVTDGATKKVTTWNSSTGCASFQVCAYGVNECKPMQPRCNAFRVVDEQ